MPEAPNLIRRFHAGESNAFAELVSTHQDDLYTLCLRAVGLDKAEALAETVLLAAHQALHRLDPDTHLYNWLMQLTVEHIQATSPLECGPNDGLEEGSATIQTLLDDLDLHFRVAVIMRDIIRLPESQIAEILELPLGTIRSRIHRARLTMARGIAPIMDNV
jgi:RNA polymerase sigma-70 factor (ECF subfamily)